MSERTCKKCGHIETGIWGYVGLFGYSLAIGALGYGFSYAMVLSGIFYPNLIVIGVILGMVCMVPMWIINFVAEKEKRKSDKTN